MGKIFKKGSSLDSKIKRRYLLKSTKQGPHGFKIKGGNYEYPQSKVLPGFKMNKR